MNSTRQFRPDLKGSGRRRVPPLLQMESVECGAACLGMILAYHGRWVPLEVLRVDGGVSWDGANAAAVMRAGRQYGLAAQGFRATRAQTLELPFPMMAFWDSNHFVVLESFRGRFAYVNDPAAGPARISLHELDRSSSGYCFVFEPGAGFRRTGQPPSVLAGLRTRFGVAMFAYDPRLALAVTGFVAVSLAVMRFTARARDIVHRNIVKDRGRLAGASVGGIHTIETLRGTGSEDDFLARRAGLQTSLLNEQHRSGAIETKVGAATVVISQLSVADSPYATLVKAD